jgi:ribosomal protein L7/L12
MVRRRRLAVITDPCFHVILIDPGPNRLAVILRVRQLLGLSLADSRQRVDAGDVVLAEGGFMDRCLHNLRDELTSLGAIVKLS